MVMLPVLFFSILVRKFLVHGLTAGAPAGARVLVQRGHQKGPLMVGSRCTISWESGTRLRLTISRKCRPAVGRTRWRQAIPEAKDV